MIERKFNQKEFFIASGFVGLILFYANLPKSFLWLSLIIIAIIATGFYGYKFFIQKPIPFLRDFQEIIESTSVAMLIADNNHNVIYLNNSFTKLPLSSLISRCQYLPEILSIQPMNAHLSEQNRKNEYEKILNDLCTKIKIQLAWNDEEFEWIMIPILKDSKRCGTLIECSKKKRVINMQPEDSTLSSMVEQFPVPFLLIDNQQNVSYLNLSLKMILIRHQSLIKERCPDFDFDNPLGESLNNFLMLNEEKDYSKIISGGSLDFALKEENFQLSFQPLWGNDHQKLGTLIVWHEKVIETKIENKNEKILCDPLENNKKMEDVLLEGF